MKTLLKSIGAVLVGFIVVAALSTLTDYILESLGIFPPLSEGFFITWMIVLALVYRTVYTVLGGYITARLAPHNPMRHVVILGSIGLIMSVLGLVATWNMNLGPHWYPIVLALLAFPSVWFGGKLAHRTTTTPPSSF